jgi:DNA-binding CsgD family transcriptional regulator
MELTETEFRVAEFVAKGFSEKEIANQMYISPMTVHNHTYRIRKKWNARSAVDVARKFILANPQKFFTVMAFLTIQLHIVFHCADMDLRRPARTSVRTVRTSRKK